MIDQSRFKLWKNNRIEVSQLLENNNGIRFDLGINLGNVITILVLIITLTAAWVRIDARLGTVEAVSESNRVILQQNIAMIQELKLATSRLAILTEIYIPKVERLESQAGR